MLKAPRDAFCYHGFMMDIQALQSLEKKLLSVEGRADAEFINEVLADDFEECGASGRIFGKDDVLSRLPYENASVSFDLVDIETKFIAESIAMNCFIVKVVAKDSSRSSRRVSLWRHVGEDWQMFYHQGTNLKAD